MANQSWHEMHSSGITGGSYSLNGFFIKANSLADLEPDNEDPLPYAVHIHAHEYIHYLHNISTVAGFHIFLAGLYLFGLVVGCANESGLCEGDGVFTVSQRRWMTSLIGWLVALKGGGSWRAGEEPRLTPVQWHFSPPIHQIREFETQSQLIEVEVVSISGIARDAKGDDYAFTFDVGYDLITEGVAYEVDRGIRHANGGAEDDLDKFTPPYPYLVYGALIDYLLGRQSTVRERILIGVNALQSTSPGATLAWFCEQAKKGMRLTLDDGQILTTVVSEEATELLFTKSLGPVLEELTGSRTENWGGFDFRELLMEGFKQRATKGMLEFSFLNGPMDSKAFRSHVGSMVDCCVMQEMPEKKVRLEWIGPRLVAKNEEDIERIGRFQASFHYALSHVDPSGKLHPTSTLRPVACPYSGGCQVEIDDGMPHECKTKPWTRYQNVPLGGAMCWYAAGVRSLGNHSRQNATVAGSVP